jgi:hypothetical protein
VKGGSNQKHFNNRADKRVVDVAQILRENRNSSLYVSEPQVDINHDFAIIVFLVAFAQAFFIRLEELAPRNQVKRRRDRVHGGDREVGRGILWELDVKHSVQFPRGDP